MPKREDIQSILIIGAGVSGIGVACRLARRFPDKRIGIPEWSQTATQMSVVVTKTLKRPTPIRPNGSLTSRRLPIPRGAVRSSLDMSF